ncbi:uncharacterized protein LOC114261461 [Camellia sinensis]|uniref:uncharacterized protein LOC114261461 n=1 Tax=Camellia sinensis TaxID=4442 RepID=UPI0010366D60|nr:uncharacterized protein LOC114261461 [Camellia sinensis]
MAPYKALYGRKCRSSICWIEVGDRVLLGPEIVQTTTKKIKVIQQRLKTAQSQQKSYVDHRRRALEYEASDHMFIRVIPMSGLSRFSNKGKLSPRYIGPFQILERLGPVEFGIALLLGMGLVHNVFHVSMLRGYLRDSFHVIDYHRIAVDDNMEYEERPIQIIDRQVKQLRTKAVSMVKIEWRKHYGTEATWEKEDEMGQKYPELFLT